jgi:lipopolysaccharide transport system ATP-binding protein
MMGSIAIRVENLSKRYVIGAAQERQDTLRDWLVAAGRSLRRRKVEENEFWALRDVSFTVQRGEVVGVIGRNGAGKSTLLKILSRITEPTSGRALINGRMGSLLEVGTGFHPELTGRENIFLNGAILGMRRAEIARKFDEIVAFAEIEKFLDTPVKRYSSGMYVRLAFAVAAHLEPEILLVDEVLAVGDAAFQKKCLGKMGDVAKEGRTVLFVSHNMSAVQRLCQNAIFLRDGRMIDYGNVQKIIDLYWGPKSYNTSVSFQPKSSVPIFIKKIEIIDRLGVPIPGRVELSEEICILLTYEVTQKIRGAHPFLNIHANNGETVLSTGDSDTNPLKLLEDRLPGVYTARVRIPPYLLGTGYYSVTWSAGIPFQVNFDVEWHAINFEVIDTCSERGDLIHFRKPGYLGLNLEWQYDQEN